MAPQPCTAPRCLRWPTVRTVYLGTSDFAVTVLRDVFAHDEEVRRWLLAPSSAADGLTPADLLSSGCVREFTDLAVAEWNRPRAAYEPADSIFGRPLERR